MGEKLRLRNTYGRIPLKAPSPPCATARAEIAQKAFHANRERLKAERLAREAAETPAAKKAKIKKKDR